MCDKTGPTFDKLNNQILFGEKIVCPQNYSILANKISLFHSKNNRNGQPLLTYKDIRSYLESNLYFIFFDDVSLSIIQVIELEAEIITLVVDSNFRNKNIGTRLLYKTLENLRLKKVKKIFLEVSEKNIAALKIYKKFGFIKYGIRKNYYIHNRLPPESAISMYTEL